MIFRLQPQGFRNPDLRPLIAQCHRYRVTDTGLHTAVLITRTHERLLPAGLALLNDPRTNSHIRATARAYQTAIDNLAHQQGLAA